MVTQNMLRLPKVLLWEKKILLSIYTDALNRSNNMDFSLRAHLFLSYLPSILSAIYISVSTQYGDLILRKTLTKLYEKYVPEREKLLN